MDKGGGNSSRARGATGHMRGMPQFNDGRWGPRRRRESLASCHHPSDTSLQAIEAGGHAIAGAGCKLRTPILESYVAPNPFKKNEIRKFHNCHVTTPIYTAGPTEFNGPFLGFRSPRFYVSRERLNFGARFPVGSRTDSGSVLISGSLPTRQNCSGRITGEQLRANLPARLEWSAFDRIMGGRGELCSMQEGLETAHSRIDCRLGSFAPSKCPWHPEFDRGPSSQDFAKRQGPSPLCRPWAYFRLNSRNREKEITCLRHYIFIDIRLST